MRNVSLVASGSRQNLDGWRRLAHELAPALKTIRVKSNPRAIGFLTLSLVLLAISVTHLLMHQEEMLQAVNEMFAY
jgi:hypothetical protein